MPSDHRLRIRAMERDVAGSDSNSCGARWPAAKWLCVALGVLVLGGCTTISASTYDTVKLALHQHHPLVLTSASVNARPYFQLEAIAGRNQAVLILGGVDGARHYWYGHGGVILVLDHGQLVQTVGLAQNLDGVHLPAANPFVRGLQHLTGPVTYVRHDDWSPGYRYGVRVLARLVPMGTTRLTILGRVRRVLRVDETLDAPAAHDQTTNRYWVDPRDGFIWKSEQQVAPGLTLTLVQLRPYRSKTS